MKCTDKERQTCNVEKMGCEGCYYNEDNDRDINKLIEELTNVRPDELSTEGLKLFNKINEIIDKNKELEYKYNKALSDLVQAEHKNKELEEEVMQKDLEIIGVEEYTKESMGEIIEHYYTANEDCIPVSLVEEKIEERKLWLSSNDIGYKDDYVLEVLEELLEKRK